MIEAVQRGFFKQRYELTMGGFPLTVMPINWREDGTFELQGERYVIHRERRKEFTLSDSGRTIAHARLERWSNWAIAADTGQFAVVKPSWLRSEWQVQQDGRPIGTVGKRGVFKPVYQLDVAGDMPQPLQLFALYLVLVLLRRAASSAAASS